MTGACRPRGPGVSTDSPRLRVGGSLRIPPPGLFPEPPRLLSAARCFLLSRLWPIAVGHTRAVGVSADSSMSRLRPSRSVGRWASSVCGRCRTPAFGGDCCGSLRAYASAHGASICRCPVAARTIRRLPINDARSVRFSVFFFLHTVSTGFGPRPPCLN